MCLTQMQQRMPYLLLLMLWQTLPMSLVDANGASLNPQVLATQGSSTGDLDLTLLAANVPTGATNYYI